MLHHHAKMLPTGMLNALKESADASYTQVNHHYNTRQLPLIYKLPNGGVYVKNASSFTLDAILGYDGALSLIRGILNIQTLHSYLPETYFINLDQVWVRRQFPHHISKNGGHQWHQDGALGFNFSNSNADFENGLLDMFIVWIPLDTCGADAPGLEFINCRQIRILSLPELIDANLKARYPSALFLKPVVEAGDVLVFGGNMIHRTHKTEKMKCQRTSLGIRIFSGIPERCAVERYVKFSK